MNENIIQVSLTEMRVKGILRQYDTGQKIQFDEDVAVGTHVLFSNSDIQKSKRKVVENNMVDVPNEVLKTSGTLTVDVQIVNENSETTVKTVRISVRNRKEAEDVITPENEQTFIEQIQSIMTETKEIAQSAEEKVTDFENRANSGEFNGKDGEPGPQGPVGPQGDDYVLTDADKEEIADEVVNEIQPTLDDMVPLSRTIADLPLSTDITAAELYNKLMSSFNNAVFAGMILATGYDVLQSYINGNTNVSTNTAVRHTHDNKEFLDALSDDTLSEIVQLSIETNDTSYHLIQRIKLAEDVSSVVVSKDCKNNSFSYNKIKVVIPKLYVSTTGILYIYMFDKNEKQFNFAAITSIENDSLTRFDVPIINNEYLWYEAITRRGSASPVLTSLTRDSLVETDGYVTKISINCPFVAGSEIYVYGGNEQ